MLGALERLGPLRFALQVFRVVSGVLVDAARVDFQDGRAHRIQEVAIVRDQQEAAIGVFQEAFQPLYRIEVQVVGRLVERQEAGAERETTGKGDLAYHAAGKRSHCSGAVCKAELPTKGPEAGEDRGIVLNAPSEKLVDRHFRSEPGRLLECAEREVPVPRNAARVRFDLAVQDPQKSRFARAVPADEADLLSGIDSHGHLLEKGGVTEGFAHPGE